jgi:hypothetical protein
MIFYNHNSVICFNLLYRSCSLDRCLRFLRFFLLNHDAIICSSRFIIFVFGLARFGVVILVKLCIRRRLTRFRGFVLGGRLASP